MATKTAASAEEIQELWDRYKANPEVRDEGIRGAFWLFGPALVNVLTDLPDVRSTAMVYLPWLIISPLISVWPFLYDGVFVGATRAVEMRNAMLISTLLVFLPSWYLLQPYGNHGLWLAFTIFMASRAIGMHFYYRRRVLPSLDAA